LVLLRSYRDKLSVSLCVFVRRHFGYKLSL
jgi:hypothetical protein